MFILYRLKFSAIFITQFSKRNREI